MCWSPLNLECQVASPSLCCELSELSCEAAWSRSQFVTPSQQLLDNAQDFLDALGLIPPMGYSPDMMREDSLPLRTPSPLSFLPQIEDHPWAPALRPLPLISPEMEWVSYYFLLLVPY